MSKLYVVKVKERSGEQKIMSNPLAKCRAQSKLKELRSSGRYEYGTSFWLEKTEDNSSVQTSLSESSNAATGFGSAN